MTEPQAQMTLEQIKEALERVKTFQAPAFGATEIKEAQRFATSLIHDLAFATQQLLLAPPLHHDEWGAGEKENWRDHGEVLVGQGFNTQRLKLIYGEHPHSRSDNHHYVNFPHSKEPTDFDGHRTIVDVIVESYNYLKSSGLSGDEVRKGGLCKIFFDKHQVYEFFFRDPTEALSRAARLIPKIMEHSLHRYWDPAEEKKIVGRLIFYREIPAVITRVLADQGCIIVARRDGFPWPPAIYDEQPQYADRELEVKLDIIDPTENIWYFDNPAAHVVRRLSEGRNRNGDLSRAGELHGDHLHDDKAQRGSGGGGGEGRQGDEGRPGPSEHGEARSSDIRAGGRPVVPRGPVEGTGLEPGERRDGESPEASQPKE